MGRTHRVGGEAGGGPATASGAVPGRRGRARPADSLRPVRIPVRLALVLAAAASPVLAGCGTSGGIGCTGTVCTVESDGPGTYDLDELGGEVEVSDLQADSVVVRINSEERTLRRDAAAQRLRGYLVSAEETGTDRVKLRIER